MYEGPVAERHNLVQGRDLILPELMLDKLLSYSRVGFCNRI